MKNKEIVDKIKLQIPKFKHRIYGKVEFSETDLLGVVHNVRYFYWAERARVEYLNDIGLKFNSRTFLSKYPSMIAHAEADYFFPAGFGDNYEVFTRVSEVRNSSMKMENLIVSSKGLPLAQLSGIIVYLDPHTKETMRIPEEIRNLIAAYEGKNVNFIG